MSNSAFEWVTWLVGIGLMVLLAALVFLAWWALFADRARGRRRCPRCWYDLTYTPSMTCAECGFMGRNDRDFRRTRKRKGLALLAILGCTAIGLFVIDRANTRGWVTFVPTQALILTLPLVDNPQHPIIVDFDRRIRSNELSDDQWLTLMERCVAGDAGARPPSEEWESKYGRLVWIGRARAARADEDTWRDEMQSLMLAIPPRLELSTRPSWPAGVAPTVDVRAQDWWPQEAQWRIRAQPRVEGARPDIHTLLDDPIQTLSYSILLPPFAAGAHEVPIDLSVERRLDPDAPWQEAFARTERLPIVASGAMADTMAPVSGPELDEVIRRAVGNGLAKYTGGSLTVRIGVRQDLTHVDLFDDTAVALRLEVLRNGQLGRRLDIWWAGGTLPPDDGRQNAWEVPMLDDDVLGAPMRLDDVWEVRAVSAPDLALRVKGVSKYWEGEVRAENVPIRLQGRIAPDRGWVGEDDPSHRVDGEDP